MHDGDVCVCNVLNKEFLLIIKNNNNKKLYLINKLKKIYIYQPSPVTKLPINTHNPSLCSDEVKITRSKRQLSKLATEINLPSSASI